MKKYIALLSIIVILSMGISIVALGNDDYELPKIPLTSSSTTNPEGDSSEPEGDTSTSEDDTSKPEGDTSTSEDDTSKPEGDTSTSEDDTSKPEGDTSTSEDDTSKPEGDTSTSEDDTSKPEGDTSKPEGDTSDNNETSGGNENSTLPTTDNEFEAPGVPLDDVSTTAAPATTQPTTTKAPERISVSKCNISGITDKTYTGKALYQKFTVKYGKKALVNKTDFTVTYKNNKNVGTATVTVTGIGKYKDKVTRTFKINPKGTTLSKVTSPKSKQIKAIWKKQATQTTGYQIQVATNSKFTQNKKTVTVNSYKKTNTTISKLKGKKKYYVRIRTYKTVKNVKYYSSWSKAKTVTTKK